jgi:hypothetical protein
MRRLFARLKTTLALAAAVGCAAAAPAKAQGLFQTLFNEAQPQPSYYRYAPDVGLRFAPAPQRDSHAAARAWQKSRAEAARKLALKRKARVEKMRLASLGPIISLKASTSNGVSGHQKPICCANGENAAEALKLDPTLRPGDAFMTPEGLKIYSGRASSKSGVRLIEPRKAGMDRGRLSSVAGKRHFHDAKIQTIATDPKGAGPDRRIVDQQGRTIRVIGPYIDYSTAPARVL